MTKPTTIAPIKHRNSVKSFFITFPRSNVSKQSFYDSFSSKYSVDKSIVVEESHKDGTPHIHMAVVLNDKVTKSQLISFYTINYPQDYQRIDIQGMRSWNESFRYLTLPDKDKEVDAKPLLVNCSIDDLYKNLRHDYIHHELKYLPPLEIAQVCRCTQCIKLLHHEIHEIFGDDPRIVRQIFQN